MKQQLFVKERAYFKYRAYLLYIVEGGKKNFSIIRRFAIDICCRKDFDIV